MSRGQQEIRFGNEDVERVRRWGQPKIRFLPAFYKNLIFQGSSQWLGERSALFDRRVLLCADWPASGSGYLAHQDRHRCPLRPHARLCRGCHPPAGARPLFHAPCWHHHLLCHRLHHTLHLNARTPFRFRIDGLRAHSLVLVNSFVKYKISNSKSIKLQLTLILSPNTLTHTN